MRSRVASAEAAAASLQTAGFEDIDILTDEQYNPCLIDSDPKQNQHSMEKTFLGIVVGIFVGAIMGWIAGLALGKLWAAVGAAVLWLVRPVTLALHGAAPVASTKCQ